MQKFTIATLWVASMITLAGSTSWATPKYGPNATPLSKKTNLSYFQKNPAPDYWALFPYYLPQVLGQQCSAANISMILNAARSHQVLTSDQKLVTIDNLLNDYSDDRYKAAMSGKIFDKLKFSHSDVSNARLADVLNIAVKKLKLVTPATEIKAVAIDLKDLPKSRKLFHDQLVENEKSSDDFILVSFVQGILTGDPEGGAHVATVGAYDEKNKLVLVFDPDRTWYEPYWTPEDKLFDSILDPRSDYQKPGWIYIKLR